MTINESNFIYANEDSISHGVFLCSIETVNTDTNDEESNIIMSTTPFKDTWDFHGLEKSNPLQFTLTIAKTKGGYFDAYELRTIKKWLCKSSYHWLQIDQSDISNAYYYCILTNPRPVNVGKMNAGLEFTVTCNAPYPWTDLLSKVYTVTGTKTLSINIQNDYDDYIVHPILTITSTSNGNINILNNTTNKTITFNGCTTNEIITLDSRNYKIKSSLNRVMLDHWNKNVLELIEGVNSISLTGNFTLKIQYRLPVRIGG